MVSVFFKEALHRPPTMLTHGQSATINASFFSPPRDGKSFSSISDFVHASLVIGLNASRRPNAIIRAIGTIIVLALKGETFRTLPHVRQKVFERRSPPITNYNAPASVVLPIPSFLVLASLDDAAPDSIGMGFRHPVRQIFGGRQRPATTSARWIRCFIKICSANDRLLAAVTEATKTRHPSYGVSTRNERKISAPSPRLKCHVSAPFKEILA